MGTKLIVRLEALDGLGEVLVYTLCHVTARPAITLPSPWDASCRRLQDAMAGRTESPHSDPAGLK